MITLENINITFNPGTINEVKALQSINLKINEGEFVTIIGTNGSGKSTLLNAIAGSILPDSGKIEINGIDVTREREHRRAKFISRVFQNPFSGTAPGMTIAENLLMAYQRGTNRYPKTNLNKNLLSFFQEQVTSLEMQLEERLDNIIGTLSGGQRQALTLLMAVIKKPKVLMLDEHTAALDPKAASQIIKLSKKFIQAEKLTTIMITHSMQQTLEMGTRTIMMYRGKIIDDIPLSEKQKMTVDDLLNKFGELRKKEQLTDELYEKYRKGYY